MRSVSCFSRPEKGLLFFWLLGVSLGDDGLSPVDTLVESDSLWDNNEPVTVDFANDIMPLRDAPNCDHHSGRYEPLACWLYNLKVYLPDERVKKGIFSVSVSDLVCTEFAISSIASSYNASHNQNKDPVISLDISGISATCTGKYKSTGMGGSVKATVQSDNDKPTQLSLKFVSTFYKDQIRMASAVQTQDCVTTLKVSSIKFTGSISARFIDLFSGKIASYVSSTLASQLCPLIQSNLDPLLTKAINAADHYMTGLIPDNVMDDTVQTAVARRANEDDLLDFAKDTPILTMLLDLANDVADRYLNKGLVLDVLEYFGYGNDDDDKECEDCGYFFRGFNGLVRSLTHGEVHFHIPHFFHELQNITFVVPKFGAASVVIKYIHVSGLDTLKEVDLLRHSGNQTFASSLESDLGFNMTVAVDITVTAIKGGFFQGEPLKESFYISINSTDVSMVGNLLLAIERGQFDNIEMGDVLSAYHGVRQHNFTELACVLKPLISATMADLMTQMDVAGIQFVPELKNGTLSGDPLEMDLDKLINNFLRLFLTEYKLLVTDTVTGVINGPARAHLNKYVVHLLEKLPKRNETEPSQCVSTEYNDSKTPDYFDFRSFWPLERLNRFLNKNGTLEEMNGYIDCVATYINQKVSPPGFLRSMKAGDLDFGFSNLRFENVGAVEALEFLNPGDDGLRLLNSLDVGTCGTRTDNDGDIVSSCPIPRVSFTIDMSYAKLNIIGQANITASLGDLVMAAGAIVHYDMNTFRSLTLSQLLSRAQCSAVPAAVFDLYDFSSNLGVLDLNVSSVLTGSTFDPIRLDFDSGTNESVATTVASLISWSLVSAEDWMNAMSRVLLPKAPHLCDVTLPGAPLPDDADDRDEGSIMLLWNLLFITVSFIVAQAGIIVVRQWQEPRGEPTEGIEIEPLLQSNDGSEDLDSPEMLSIDGEEAKQETPALMFSQAVPVFFRHAMPIVTIGTIWLLMSSNLSTGASVDLQVSLPDSKSIKVPELFAFSLGNTVREFYHAGIWGLLFLVVVFSGIWPYVKLKLMLFAWSAPGWAMTTERRERLLLSLDALGKFSLVDTYVLVLMVVAFRFHLDLAENASIDVFVTPGLGFYGFLLATSASLVIGHVMLFFHRRSTASTYPASGPKESLAQHEFEDRTTGQLKRMSLRFKIFVAVSIVVTFVLLSVGAEKETFNFRFGGLAGVALGDNSSKSYSMLSLGSSLRESVENPSGFGILCIQIAFFFYALVTPFCCLFMILLLFCVPMRLRTQKFCLVVAEIANAWSAIEVFVISIVASLLEISTFADFIIGDKCDLINEVLSEHFDDQMDGDDKCYSVHSSVGAEAWILFTGVALNSFLVSLLLRFLHYAMAERLTRESQDIDKEDALLADGAHGNTVVDYLFQCKLGNIVFDGDYNHLDDNDDRDASIDSDVFRSTSGIWEEWRKICSWT